MNYLHFAWRAAAAGLLAGGYAAAQAPPSDDADFTLDGAATDTAVMPDEQFARFAEQPHWPVAPELSAAFVQIEGTVAPAVRGGGEDIGYLRPAPARLYESAAWEKTFDGGYVKRVEVYSPNATALRAVLTDLGDIELRVYDPQTLSTFGPYTHPDLNDDGTFVTTIIFGDTLGLEFHVPAGYAFPPAIEPTITQIFHVYQDFEGALQPPEQRGGGVCFADIACYPEWANSNEGRAVGMMTTLPGQCTGAMLNRVVGDYAPLLMTARHCLSDQNNANNAVIIWNFQNATCNGGNAPNPNTLPRNTGMHILKIHWNSDWILLGLKTPPQTNAYCGFDGSYWFPGGMTGVHHPRSNSKRISMGNQTIPGYCSATGAHTWVCDLSAGLGPIAPGASGSPVFDGSRRVRGTLSCAAPPDCIQTSAEYGRLNVGIANLKYYLEETVDPTWVASWAAGDNNNDGDSERGTFSQPFNQVYESSFAVIAGGAMQIAPGNYNERFTIWRPMRLYVDQRNGPGVVTIGRP